jgi:DHA2 family multidrug resistance protein-like MFS transporter
MTIGSELIMGAVPPDRAGAAAAVVETSSEFGGALGMAVLGSIGIAVYRSHLATSAPRHLPPGALGAARSTLGGALNVAADLPGRLGGELAGAARTAFTNGLSTAAVGAAIAMAVAAVFCARFFRGVQVVPETDHSRAAQPAEAANAPVSS